MRNRVRLPVGVYLLAFSLFAMGSAEFLLAGVLPAVADELSVSLASAGALITAFAIGVVVGGPPFAVLSLRWPRRTTIAVTQGAFALAIAIGLLGGYEVLLVSRFVAGVAYAGFFAVAAVTAISLAGPDRAARASGVVVSGLSLAMIFGGPAGTLVSHFTHWQGGFWVVVVLTLVAGVATAVGLPATSSTTPRSAPTLELRTMRQPALWVIYAITILTTAAYMVSYNYLAAILEEVTTLPAVWIAPVLSIFGVGALVGLSIGGRVSDRYPGRALLAGAIGIATLSVLLVLLAEYTVAVVPIVFVLGVFAFVLNPAIYSRVFAIASGAPTLAGATTVSAFQLGISLTPAVAAPVLTTASSVAAVSWLGAALAVIAIPLVIVASRPKSDQEISRRSGHEGHGPASTARTSAGEDRPNRR